MNNALKRYTELPFVLQALSNRELTLLSPRYWDDKNDAFYVEHYRKRAEHGSVLAMCFSATDPTYLHWRIFTHGASGAALYFKRDAFEAWVAGQPSLQGRMVEYRKEDDLSQTRPSLEMLPYIKRWAYRAEEEYRLLLPLRETKVKAHSLSFDLQMVEKVVINPWIHKLTFESVKKIIHSIDGCSNIPVQRAAMVESSRWRKLALNI